MYWYSDDRSIQFSFDRQKSGLNKAFYGHRSSSVFLTNILKYGLDRQLTCFDSIDPRCLDIYHDVPGDLWPWKSQQTLLVLFVGLFEYIK